MNFNRVYKNLIQEISQRNLEKLKEWEDISRELPFDHIFKPGELRIVERLNNGKKYDIEIMSSDIDNEYDYDFENWSVYKKKDALRKNPIRIGKYLNNAKTKINKLLQGELEEERRKELERKLEKVEELLKTTDLQNQYKNSIKSDLYIVYSRSPIDVVRMGDFEWSTSSCHGPKGSFFYCALADAMKNAGVIYLISSNDYKSIDDINKEEIFRDDERDVRGIKPLARMRIRMVQDMDGNQLAVPTTKIYAVSGQNLNDDFIEQVLEWARKQDTTEYKWNSTLSLRGGTYEDMGYNIDQQIRKIWGREVTYKSNPSDQANFVEVENDEDEEHQLDALIADAERSDIAWNAFAEVLGTDTDMIDKHFWQEFYTETDYRLGTVEIHYKPSQKIKEKLKTGTFFKPSLSYNYNNNYDIIIYTNENFYINPVEDDMDSIQSRIKEKIVGTIGRWSTPLDFIEYINNILLKDVGLGQYQTIEYSDFSDMHSFFEKFPKWKKSYESWKKENVVSFIRKKAGGYIYGFTELHRPYTSRTIEDREYHCNGENEERAKELLEEKTFWFFKELYAKDKSDILRDEEYFIHELIMDDFTEEQLASIGRFYRMAYYYSKSAKKPEILLEIESVIEKYYNLIEKEIKKEYGFELDWDNTNIIVTDEIGYASGTTENGAHYTTEIKTGRDYVMRIELKITPTSIKNEVNEGNYTEFLRFIGDNQWKPIIDDLPEKTSELKNYKPSTESTNESTNFSKFFHFYLNQYKNK